MSFKSLNRQSNGHVYEEGIQHEMAAFCLICMEHLDSPKVLECSHAFCETCLHLYYKIYKNVQYEQLGVFVPCPTCRKLTKVPPDGLSALQQDKNELAERTRKISLASDGAMQKCDPCVFKRKMEEAYYYCGKCTMNFCEPCKIDHNQQALFKMHDVIHISNKETINLYCENHNKLPSIYFCLDCNLAICTICILQDHKDHHTAKLRDALATRRTTVKTLLNSLGPRLDKLEVKLKKLVCFVNMKHRKSNGVRISPDLSTPKPNKNGVIRRYSLQDDNPTDSDTLLRAYQYHMDRMRKLFDLGSKTLEMSQSKKLLAIYDDIVERMQTVIDLDLKHLQEEIESKLFDELSAFNDQKQLTPSVSACSLQDRMASYSSNDSSSSLEDPSLDQPQQSILIRPKLLWKMDKQKGDPGELWNPIDVSFLPHDNVVVAEYDFTNDKNNRLRILDPVGKLLDTLGQGSIKPLGVTCTKDGNIAVTDCKSKRVKIFTPAGQLMCELGKGQFGWPYGIATNSKAQLIVTDAFNDTVSIYQSDGKKVKTFGSSGSNNNQFRNPYHVTIDESDNILVSDSGNNCIKAFDSNGKFLFRSSEIRRTFSSEFGTVRKVRKRKLRGPRGICVAMKGRILVADDCSRVCMFDSAGKYVRNLLSEEDSVKYAEALETNKNGHLAVTEWNPNNMFAVKVFTLYD